MNIQREIEKIGNKLVNCSELGCSGTFKDQDKGILPRCLYFEKRSKSKKFIIVVGINPGSSEGYADQLAGIEKTPKKLRYVKEVRYWENNWKDLPCGYYDKTRRLIDCLFSSQVNILWTELVKCESKKGKKGNDILEKTIRRCTNNWFKKELKVAKEFTEKSSINKTTIVALAEKTFRYLSEDKELIPHSKYFILGVPHPTGDRKNRMGNIIWKISKHKDKKKKLIKRLKEKNELWLSDKELNSLWELTQ